LYGPTIWRVKMSLFSLIFTAFHPVAYIRLLVYIGIIVSSLFYIMSAFVNAYTCRPRRGNDRWAYLAGMASRHVAIRPGAFNILSDLYILVIPMGAIYKLKLQTRRKVGVFFIFLTGTG
ncbi:hypothetical protein GQ43DRAFT_384234, partial [Delitschia confertaspora ATCC 74209]